MYYRQSFNKSQVKTYYLLYIFTKKLTGNDTGIHTLRISSRSAFTVFATLPIKCREAAGCFNAVPALSHPTAAGHLPLFRAALPYLSVGYSTPDSCCSSKPDGNDRIRTCNHVRTSLDISTPADRETPIQNIAGRTLPIINPLPLPNRQHKHLYKSVYD